MQKTILMTLAAFALAAPTVSALDLDLGGVDLGGLEILELLRDNGGASTSCGQYGTDAHGWGSSPSASADMTVVTSSGAYGSGNDAYAWANGYGGGSARASGGVWTAYCNSALLGLIGTSDASSPILTCDTSSASGSFHGDVLQAADGTLYATDGLVSYAMAGVLDLGRASTVELPSGLTDTGIDLAYSNGPLGCVVVAQ